MNNEDKSRKIEPLKNAQNGKIKKTEDSVRLRLFMDSSGNRKLLSTPPLRTGLSRIQKFERTKL
jgi:hypothetical protein